MTYDYKNLEYFEENYFFVYLEIPNQEEYIPTNQPYVCRFCGKTKPETTFKKKAHAIPESLGNKFLKSKNECDICNTKFGQEFEDHLAKFLLPYRALTGIKGKKGPVTYKDLKTRFENLENIVKIQSDIEAFRIDEQNHKAYLDVNQQPYVPINVYKAFLKIALSVMPEEWLPDYKDLILFLQNGVFPFSKKFIRIGITEIAGNRPFVMPGAFFAKKKTPDKLVPSLYFVFIFGNYIFQLLLPSKTEDEILFKNNLKIKWIQVYIFEREVKENLKYQLVDFSRDIQTQDNKITISFNYESIEKT